MRVGVRTKAGTFAVDLDEETLEPAEEDVSPPPTPEVSLPRVVAAAAAGSTVVAVVDTRPPILVSHDAGRTWRESGGGLPAGRAVAVAEYDPDLVVFAARNRLWFSRDGGRFWSAVPIELPEIEAVAFV